MELLIIFNFCKHALGAVNGVADVTTENRADLESLLFRVSSFNYILLLLFYIITITKNNFFKCPVIAETKDNDRH